MTDQFARTQLTFGKENMEKLYKARVIVFGIGGVGSYVVEALVRSGLGAIDIVDDDKICLSNLNRQLYALHSTIGKDKVDVADERIHDINPDCKVRAFKTFFLPETKDQFDFTEYDYVVDAIDTVTGKLAIIEKANEAGVPVMSSMGAGNKIDASLFEVADIYDTKVCPLAKVMRHECKKRGIKHLKVVYSGEKPISNSTDGISPSETEEKSSGRRSIPGSTAFAPSVAGLIIAGEVINDLTGKKSIRI
jgi:tRNA A37 threonylcarbamoyladenosine dehydratase